MKLLSPVLTVALFSAILSGCGTSTNAVVPTPIDSTSSSSTTSSEASSASSVSASIPATSSQVAVPSTQTYTNGTFAAVGDYNSPAGPESVKVSLTLKNGVIQDASYQGTATLGKSQKYQEAFGQGYRDQVVGKPISSLSLDVVNGASLTSQGFMDAVAKIKVEAKKA